MEYFKELEHIHLLKSPYQANHFDGLNYTYLFFPEKIYFNSIYCQKQVMRIKEIYHRSWYYAAFYVIAVYAGQAFMKNRPAFSLRKPLIAWNVALAIFSILGTIRIWPEFIHLVKKYGIQHTYCNNDLEYNMIGCWTAAFLMSKVAELFDTAFIVLRKQSLTFLHVYHHATVLIYCWYSGRDKSASGRWFTLMNFTVHAMMYTYYAFRALRFRIPKPISIFITSAQISQMVIGIYVNIQVHLAKKRGDKCDVPDENIFFSFLMYGSYFFFFCHFFYLAYIKKSGKKPLKPSSSSSSKGLYTNGHNGVTKHLTNGKNNHKKHE